MSKTIKEKKPTKTQQVLAAMLTENTGRALCDSGGTPQYDADGKYIGSEHGYGRAFERNQGRNFIAESSAFFSITDIGDGKPDISVTANLFHWLDSRVTYDAKMTKRFKRFALTGDRKDEHWLANMQEFPLYLREKGQHVTGLYGGEEAGFSATYTYNDENVLSQDIQFVYFEVDDTGYVLLQIHNGADARGGLTEPKVFEVDDDGATMFNYGDVELTACKPDGDKNQLLLIPDADEGEIDRMTWRSENGGYSFSLDEYRGRFDNVLKIGGGKDESYETTTDPALRGQGYIYVDVDANKVYCPLTGWELEPYA